MSRSDGDSETQTQSDNLSQSRSLNGVGSLELSGSASVSYNVSNLDSRLENWHTAATDLHPQVSHFFTAEQGNDDHQNRNSTFDQDYEPFRHNKALQLQQSEVDGALSFMNPTRAVFTWKFAGNAELRKDPQGADTFDSMNKGVVSSRFHASDIDYKWTSRNNRKGRHPLIVHEYPELHNSPPSTTTLKAAANGIWRMYTCFFFRDISYLGAVLFALGCLVLVANATLTCMPYAEPRLQLTTAQTTYIPGVLTLIGCCLFLKSSFLFFSEAVNADRRGCLGWKLERVPFDDDPESGSFIRIVPDHECTHHHNHTNLFGYNAVEEYQDGNQKSITFATDPNAGRQFDPWQWLPTLKELRTHYVYDIGFLSSSLLLISSTIFTTAAIAALVIVFKYSSSLPNWVRILQILASLGFVSSQSFFVLETQRNWYQPLPNTLGWHISMWSLVGSLGFTLTAVFAIIGSFGHRWAEYHFVYSYLWGSCAFTIGSLLQWYEALDKYPVETKQQLKPEESEEKQSGDDGETGG